MKNMSRFCCLILFAMFCAVNINAQDKKDKIVMPEYPGGEAALKQFLMNELVYPYEAANANEIGEVLVGFLVGKDGSVSAVRVLKSVSSSLDAEAVRVVKMMKYWHPGTRNGVPVPASMSIPINFRIVKEHGKFIDSDDNSARGVRFK